MAAVRVIVIAAALMRVILKLRNQRRIIPTLLLQELQVGGGLLRPPSAGFMITLGGGVRFVVGGYFLCRRGRGGDVQSLR